ncbi:hypothetical protein EHR02_12840 [Leptospira levettii]|uniref:hypothetical protein n=1 Tax=Leptospira levettii TaxID=2023178 RepID=UPI001082D197|nr:hypothetical protein [Leptospira levettii]TGM93606.1 hypothetical protein EHR02_12840 [Leptospira levettii]
MHKLFFITLRVKDNGSGSGHTISLQRNPMKDGRYTYTVVDVMIYTPNFPEKDWDEITNHVIAILNSVTMR